MAGLRQICIGVFPLHHDSQIAGIELARRDLGGADVGRRFDGGDATHGILRWADPGSGASMGPDRLNRKAVAECDVVTDLVQS